MKLKYYVNISQFTIINFHIFYYFNHTFFIEFGTQIYCSKNNTIKQIGRTTPIRWLYKYYVMNYSINSFTGASEAPVNVVVVY